MKIGLIVIGKTDAGYFVEAINEYKNRLTHYIPFEMEVIPDIKNVKNLSEAQQKEKEGELILTALQPGDYLVLLEGVHLHAIFYLSGKENAYGPETLGICGGRSLRF